MTEFKVTASRLKNIRSHPYADSLDVANVYDYTVILKKNSFNENQLIAYIPIDSIVPDTEEWYFLCPTLNDGSKKYSVGSVPSRYRKIEPKKIRGVFSQGLVTQLPIGDWNEGDDLKTTLGIQKFEPKLEISLDGENESLPHILEHKFPIYTDVEGIKRHPDILKENEEIVISEKIHGTNARYLFTADSHKLWVGSHRCVKKRNESNVWWKIAIALDLETKLKLAPEKVFFGEIYGNVQDIKYDLPNSITFRVFDVFDSLNLKYLDYDDAKRITRICNLDFVPELYRGPWNKNLNSLCEGQSLLAKNVREGFIVKPTKERYDPHVGRVILKRHGEGYLLRKSKHIEQH